MKDFLITFRAIAAILNAEVIRLDGCYHIQTTVGKFKLILQYEPFYQKVSALGELDNPSQSNTFDLAVDTQELRTFIRAVVTMQAASKLGKIGVPKDGWKTYL